MGEHDAQSFEDHFNEQNKGFGNQSNDVGRRDKDIAKDSDELHERYAGQPGTHGMDESDFPHYQVDHPSGWTVRTHGGPYLEVGHQATPGEAHDAIDVSHPDPQRQGMHPALTQGTPEQNHNALAAELHHFVKHYGEDYAQAYPKIKQWQQMRGLSNTGMKKQAHDSGDGETIYHCPFCGSGQVIARSDKTIECEFCHTCFTVQVQPEFSAFPQTIDGMPVQVPGMPGQMDPNMGMDPGMDPGMPPPGAEGEVPEEEGEEEPEEDDSGGGNPFTSKRATAVPYGNGLMTPSGIKIPVEDYLAHLALTTTANRDQTLAQVRARRCR